MIKALILDIDGVIVGDKKGINAPDPHPDVIKKLKQIRTELNIPIILCTAKPHFSIMNIVRDAKLDNPHITDGGAVLINPVKDSVLKKYPIDKDVSLKILSKFVERKIYTEFYTVEDYYIQKSETSNITKTHSFIIQREPKMVDSLVKSAETESITKIMPIVNDEESKESVKEVFGSFEDHLTLNWTMHPIANPLQFGVITAKDISKKQGAEEIMGSLGISFADTLGVGDSTSDWNFIQLCNYKAAMGNASNELKELVSSTENSLIGPTVDENGIITVLDYFLQKYA